MSRLRAVLPSLVAQPKDSVLSLVLTGPVSFRQASSAELVGKSPRRTRCAKRRLRPVCVIEGSVGDLPILTIQDPVDVQGEMVYDCRCPLLPVSLQIVDCGPGGGIVRDSGFVPGTSPSCIVCRRAGPCVGICG